MKKKQNAKERRQQADAKMSAVTADIAEKKQKELQQKKEEQERLEKEKARAVYAEAEKAYLAENKPDERSKKSGPKAAGVKSLFMIKQGEMLMTSFGKGNDAIPEKAVHCGVIEDLQDKPAFSAVPKEKGYIVSGRKTKNAVLDDPSQSNKACGDDLIGLRKQFETLYFGQTFEDNIHIQLIYNILDIEKILTVHINNIIYEINNLLRKDGDEAFDLFQSLDAGTSYGKFTSPNSDAQKRSFALFEELMHSPRRAYFGDVLFREQKKRKGRNQPSEDDAEERRCYYLLALLGTVRHSLAHGASSTSSIIYQLDGAKKVIEPEALKYLDSLYAEKIKAINKDFIEHARQKNLPVLFEALNVTDQTRKTQLARDYYDFVVRKEYKNLGFSIKKIRELILLLPDAKALSEQRYDSVRSKLYMLFDFVVFDWYRRHAEQANELVGNLRGALNEEDKLRCYTDSIELLWKDIKPTVMDHIAEKLSESRVAEIRPIAMSEDVLNGVLLGQDATNFSKLMYLLTCFQDGKEINDLLTTLINKFENIAGFLQVLKERGLPVSFKQEYQMFEQSSKIAGDLRTINAFARMAKTDAATKKTMFIDAAYLLGFQDSEEALEKIIDAMLDKNSGELLPNGKKNNGFRNFIINNVIESRRFQYLVRYGDPKKLCKLARSEKVVAFILKDIPDAQIVRYYNSCKGMNAAFSPDMRKELRAMIANVNFADFESIRTNARYANAEQNIEKERKKAIVRLYLTVLYLLVKNLVYVNSRYFLAFHCVERDAMAYDSEKYKIIYKEKWRLGEFAKERVEHGKLNKYATRYVLQNFENSEPAFIAGFRNFADHLNVVRSADAYINDIAHFDSYFELYHYLLQRCLMDDFRKWAAKLNSRITEETVNPKMLTYFALIEKYHTYCKDMVKALNVPFAYNLPRYKNLSINELFDRNNYLPEKAGKEAMQTE